MGNIIRTERYTLYHADALDVLRQLPSDSVEAVICDPPYSSGGFTRSDRNQAPSAKYQQGGTFKLHPEFSGNNRDQRAYAYWTQLWVSEALRIVTPSGYLLTFADWRQLPTTTDALQAGGFVWRGLVVWNKGESARAPHKGYFRHQSEFIVWGTKGVSKPLEHGGPFPGVIRCNAPRNRQHMTEKPVELMQQLVQVVPPNGTVLDPFGGAHTTGVAALNMGRRYIGIEQTPHYHQIGAERVEAASRRKEIPTHPSN